MRTVFAVAIAMLAALECPGQAQTVLFSGWDTPDLVADQYSNLGASSASLGDVDGDGFGDFCLGSPSIAGEIRAYSGKDGALLYVTVGPWSFGSDVSSVQDLDGDGVCEIAVSAPVANRVFLVSGGTGDVLQEFGPNVIGNGFGFDMCTGHLGELEFLIVLIRDAVGPEPGWQSSLAVFDIQSGVELISLGIPGEHGVSPPAVGFVESSIGLGRIVVRDSSAAGSLWQWSVESLLAGPGLHVAQPISLDGFATKSLGGEIVVLSDIDGDSLEEIAILEGGSDHALVVSPGSGEVVQAIPNATRISSAGDFDGDGSLDLVLSNPDLEFDGAPNLFNVGTGAVRVRSVRENKDLCSGGALLRWERFGHSLGSLGDVNGDGRGDVVIVSERWADIGPAVPYGSSQMVEEAAYVLSFDSSAASQPGVFTTDYAMLTESLDFVFEFDGSVPEGAPYVVLVSTGINPQVVGNKQVDVDLSKPIVGHLLAVGDFDDSLNGGGRVMGLTGTTLNYTTSEVSLMLPSSLEGPLVLYAQAFALGAEGQWCPAEGGGKELLFSDDLVPASTLAYSLQPIGAPYTLEFYDPIIQELVSYPDAVAAGYSITISMIGMGEAFSGDPEGLLISSLGVVDFSDVVQAVGCGVALVGLKISISGGVAGVTIGGLGVVLGCGSYFYEIDYAYSASFISSGGFSGTVTKSFEGGPVTGSLSKWGAGPYSPKWSAAQGGLSKSNISFHSPICPNFWPGDVRVEATPNLVGVSHGKVAVELFEGSCNGGALQVHDTFVGNSNLTFQVKKKDWLSFE